MHTYLLLIAQDEAISWSWALDPNSYRGFKSGGCSSHNLYGKVLVVAQEVLLKKAMKVFKILPMREVVVLVEPENANPAAHVRGALRTIVLMSVLGKCRSQITLRTCFSSSIVAPALLVSSYQRLR